MWRIAVVDDDPDYRRVLTGYLHDFFADREAYECAVFEGGADFLAQTPSDLDVVFLDIVMGRTNGVDVAHALRERDENVAIVFVTEAVQYALEGYGVRAADFLVKPLYYTSFATCMQRVMAQVARRKPTMLRIDYDKTVHYLDTSSVFYIETRGKRVVVHAQSGDYPCSDTMKDLEVRLAPFGFGRCHHACIVNAAYVETVRKNEVLVHGVWVPLSRQRRDGFMAFLLRELGGAV
jgi:DNA-binding LytR/AlgR family response regulator